MLSQSVVDFVGNFMFITFPIVGYIPQLVRKRILFAPILSIMTVCCNMLKLFYWKGNDMPVAIVYQSLLLMIFHLILLYNNKNDLSAVEEKIIEKSKMSNNYKKYGLFKLSLSLIVSLVISLTIINAMFSGICFIWGHLAMVLESSVGLVQLLILNMDSRYEIPANDLFKIEKNFPKELYLCWALGDMLKLIWMYHIASPLIFYVSVVFQIVVDLFLVLAH